MAAAGAASSCGIPRLAGRAEPAMCNFERGTSSALDLVRDRRVGRRAIDNASERLPVLRSLRREGFEIARRAPGLRQHVIDVAKQAVGEERGALDNVEPAECLAG